MQTVGRALSMGRAENSNGFPDPLNSDLLRKRNLAVYSGHAGMVALIVAGIVGTLLKGAKVLLVTEVWTLAGLGVVYLALCVWGSLMAVRLALPASGVPPAPNVSPWFMGFYFVLQLGLALALFRVAEPARPTGTLWLILLPPIGHSVLLLSREGITLVSLSCLSIFAATVVAVQGWGAVLQRVMEFSFAVIFTLVFTQMAMNAERARRDVERLAQELSVANAELREHAVEVEELATTRERNRLAREIHDSVGHYLTVVNVQIEAARVVMERDPAKSLAALQKAQSLTQDGLREIRRSVTALRDSPLEKKSLPEALYAVVSEIRLTGMTTEMEVLGNPRTVSPQTGLTLYRAGQEGITNARKHSNANQVRVVLDFRQDGRVKLDVTDNGAGAANTSGGFGLIGLRERAELLGGTMRVRTMPGEGFSLAVEVPG